MRYLIVLISLTTAAHAQQIERIERDAECVVCHEVQADDVKPSVHAAANVGCVSCHGADDVDMRQTRGNPHRKVPGFRIVRRQNIPEDCGACHQAELDSLKLGDHYTATKWGEDAPRRMKGCVDCHAHHATTRANRVELLAACARCHAADTSEYAGGRILFAAVETFERELGRTGDLLRRLERSPGIPIVRAKQARAAGIEAVRDLRVGQHGLRFKELGETGQRASESVAAAYNRLIEQERAFGQRWVWLLPFLAVVAASMALVRVKARELRKGA